MVSHHFQKEIISSKKGGAISFCFLSTVENKHKEKQQRQTIRPHAPNHNRSVELSENIIRSDLSSEIESTSVVAKAFIDNVGILLVVVTVVVIWVALVVILESHRRSFILQCSDSLTFNRLHRFFGDFCLLSFHFYIISLFMYLYFRLWSFAEFAE